MKSPFGRILVRWLASSLGLWVASRLVDGVIIDQQLKTILWVGLLFSVVNFLIKPAVVILSLPAIAITLGIFLIVINGFMVWIVDALSSKLTVSGFGAAMLAGLIIGLVNYLVSMILEDDTAA